MAKPNPKAPVGQGGRFAALEKKFEKQGVSKERAEGRAAAIGRKKYGAVPFQKLASAGRKAAP